MRRRDAFPGPLWLLIFQCLLRQIWCSIFLSILKLDHIFGPGLSVRVFRVRLACPLVDKAKWIPFLLWVSLIQSTEELNRPTILRALPSLPRYLGSGTAAFLGSLVSSSFWAVDESTGHQWHWVSRLSTADLGKHWSPWSFEPIPSNRHFSLLFLHILSYVWPKQSNGVHYDIFTDIHNVSFCILPPSPSLIPCLRNWCSSTLQLPKAPNLNSTHERKYRFVSLSLPI